MGHGRGSPNLVLRRSFDGQNDAVLVGQRATEHDEAGVDEAFHELGVRVPARLLLQRPRHVPFRAERRTTT